MKKLLILTLLALSSSAYAQTNSPDSVVGSNGVTYRKGEDITLGTGSAFDKSFVYVYTAPGLTTPIKLPSGWADYKMRIKGVKYMGSKKRGFKTILILGGGNIVNYWMELEPAIRAGEILTIKEKQ